MQLLTINSIEQYINMLYGLLDEMASLNSIEICVYDLSVSETTAYDTSYKGDNCPCIIVFLPHKPCHRPIRINTNKYYITITIIIKNLIDRSHFINITRMNDYHFIF